MRKTRKIRGRKRMKKRELKGKFKTRGKSFERRDVKRIDFYFVPEIDSEGEESCEIREGRKGVWQTDRKRLA
jgi:hypothetical protein